MPLSTPTAQPTQPSRSMAAARPPPPSLATGADRPWGAPPSAAPLEPAHRFGSVGRLHARGVALLESAQPLALLAARLYVASVFLRSGLTKLRDWDTTLALFADEYRVPLLSPVAAAWAGTFGELVLPVLLAAGLFGRFAAAGLGVVNVVAVLSLADVPDAALQGHVFWGSLLALLLLWGPGALSLDRAWQRWPLAPSGR